MEGEGEQIRFGELRVSHETPVYPYYRVEGGYKGAEIGKGMKRAQDKEMTEGRVEGSAGEKEMERIDEPDDDG